MNLSNLANQYVKAVNPNMDATFYRSAGWTKDIDGSRIPAFAAPIIMQAQWQSFTYNDLMQLDGLNIQGEKRCMYLNGDWDGVSRADGLGGDKIVLNQNNTTWLVCKILENWEAQDGWVKVAVVRQMS